MCLVIHHGLHLQNASHLLSRATLAASSKLTASNNRVSATLGDIFTRCRIPTKSYSIPMCNDNAWDCRELWTQPSPQHKTHSHPIDSIYTPYCLGKAGYIIQDHLYMCYCLFSPLLLCWSYKSLKSLPPDLRTSSSPCYQTLGSTSYMPVINSQPSNILLAILVHYLSDLVLSSFTEHLQKLKWKAEIVIKEVFLLRKSLFSGYDECDDLITREIHSCKYVEIIK